MLMRVSLKVAAGLQTGQQVEYLIFRQSIQQSERHQRRLLRLPFFDVGILEGLEERIGRTRLNGDAIGIFLDDHAEHFVSILEFELMIPVAIVDFQRWIEDLH